MKRLCIILCLYGAITVGSQKQQYNVTPRRLAAFMGHPGALTDFKDSSEQVGTGLYESKTARTKVDRRLSTSFSSSQVIPPVICTAIALKDRRTSSSSAVELEQDDSSVVASSTKTHLTVALPARRKSSVSFDLASSLHSVNDGEVQPFAELQERLRRGSNFSQVSSEEVAKSPVLPSVARLSITGVEQDPEKLTLQLQQTHESIAQAQTLEERKLLLQKAKSIVNLITVVMFHFKDSKEQFEELSDDLVLRNHALRGEVTTLQETIMTKQKALDTAEQRLKTCNPKRCQELAEQNASLQRTVHEKNARLKLLQRVQATEGSEVKTFK